MTVLVDYGACVHTSWRRITEQRTRDSAPKYSKPKSNPTFSVQHIRNMALSDFLSSLLPVIHADAEEAQPAKEESKAESKQESEAKPEVEEEEPEPEDVRPSMP